MEDTSIGNVNGAQPSNTASNSGILTENLPHAQAAADIEEVVQNEVQRAVQEVLEANRQVRRQEQPPLATVLPRSTSSEDGEQGDEEETVEEENKSKNLCGLPKWAFYLLVVVVTAAIVAGIVSTAKDNDILATDIPSMDPTTQNLKILSGLLYPNQTMDSLLPAQYEAIHWIVDEDSFLSSSTVVTQELLERHALVTMYFGLGGENWTFTNWLEAGISHCEWENVGCDDTYSIKSIQLGYGGLQGSLAEEIGMLSNLKELLLPGNQKLTGQLPIQLYDLTLLTRLDVSSCKLTGSIPSDIGRLSMLEVLKYGANQLHGHLPSEVGMLSNLKEVVFADNSLSGQIPNEIAQWSLVQNIHLKGNTFTGAIPEVRLERLESLDLSRNRLNSTFPTEFLTSATNLLTLIFNNNHFGSTLPLELFALTQLEDLSLENIALNGEFPSAIGNLTSLTQLVLTDNPNIKGPLPSEIGNLKSLQFLSMDRLTNLGLTPSNSTLPTELGTLAKLESLGLEGCSLGGSIPAEIGDLSQLNFLFLSDNRLTGSLPNSIGKMENLRSIQLNNNLLNSTVPAQLRLLTNLHHINLSNNSLTGRFPGPLDDFLEITDVYLYGNMLTGGLENLFCGPDFPKLKDFQVDCELGCECCTLECVSYDDARGIDP